MSHDNIIKLGVEQAKIQLSHIDYSINSAEKLLSFFKGSNGHGDILSFSDVAFLFGEVLKIAPSDLMSRLEAKLSVLSKEYKELEKNIEDATKQS